MKEHKYKESRFLLVLLVFCWLLIVSLAKDFGRVSAGFERIDKANRKLSVEQEKNTELKKKMTYAQSEYYKEKIVREKLNMQRPGEMMVVLPETIVVPGDGEMTAEEKVQKNQNNWQKWWNLVRN